jgi:hypothetical protein
MTSPSFKPSRRGKTATPLGDFYSVGPRGKPSTRLSRRSVGALARFETAPPEVSRRLLGGKLSMMDTLDAIAQQLQDHIDLIDLAHDLPPDSRCT